LETVSVNLDASCDQATLLMFCRCDPFDRDAERKAEERPESERRNANCRVRCNLSLCVFAGQVSIGENPNIIVVNRAIKAGQEKSRPLDWCGRLSGELFGLACGLTACSIPERRCNSETTKP